MGILVVSCQEFHDGCLQSFLRLSLPLTRLFNAVLGVDLNGEVGQRCLATQEVCRVIILYDAFLTVAAEQTRFI